MTIIIKKITIPQTTPVKNPEPSSRPANFNLLDSLISPVEIPRMATASDLVPVLPAIPEMTGIKALKRTTLASVSSKKDNIQAVIIPIKVSPINHGKRFLAVSKAESDVDSLSDIPARRE